MKRLLASLYVLPAAVLMLGSAALVSIPIWPTAVIPRYRREAWSIHGARLFAWLSLRTVMWARTTVVGADHLPPRGTRPDGSRHPGYLVICNHRSWADVPLLMLHTWAQGISKKEIQYIPFFGWNGYLSGGIFFDRKNPRERAGVIDEAVKLMGGGASLMLFPEGTRTRDGKLREKVHLKLVCEAWERGHDVVPCCVWGTEEAVPVRGIGVLPGAAMGLEIARPLDRGAFPDGDAYAAACWEAVREMAARRGVA